MAKYPGDGEGQRDAGIVAACLVGNNGLPGNLELIGKDGLELDFAVLENRPPVKAMRLLLLCSVAALGALVLSAERSPAAEPAPSPSIARLERRGAATQLIVDGKPYLVLGGETDNTASSSLEYMDTVWPALVKLNVNTVLVGVGWDWVEPVEGQFDFKLVDGLLAGARKNNLHLIFLWFGSWKNGLSSFAPDWVKEDQKRFPRERLTSGKAVEVLTPFSDAVLQADLRAYTVFMHHLGEADARQHTVIMIQLENEVGLLGDSRDRSSGAAAAFGQPVPHELMDYLQKNKGTLWPDLAKVWQDAGGKMAGTWREVFGNSTAADEIFMAWNYARFMNHLALAGKAEDPVPVFTNTWLVQPGDNAPGDYPSGCPEPLVIDIWKAGAPGIDINAPDVHLPNFTDWASQFWRPNNPFFVPESSGDAAGAANAADTVSQYFGIGYSPFGINRTPADAPIGPAYGLLAEMAPIILDAQEKGTIGGAWLNAGHPAQDVAIGNYVAHVELWRNRRNPADMAPMGYALVISTGPGEYFVAGSNVQVTFSPDTPGPQIAGLADAETGKFEKGKWIPGRKMNGDDVLLDYHQAAAAAGNQSGSGLIFRGAAPVIQRVKLYRYE